LDLDAIIISDLGRASSSDTNPLSLKLDGRSGTLQAVLNYLEHRGRIVPPIHNDGIMSWWSAPRLNGISLLSHLIKHDFDVELITKYYKERDYFCQLLQHTPRVAIISTTFIQTKKALGKLVDDIRSLAPDITIIVGGTLVYMSYLMLQRSHEKNYVTESAKNDFLFFTHNEPSVDLYIISLLGEQILCEALKRIKKNQPLDNLPNTARLVGKNYHFTKRIDDISNAGEAHIDWKSLPDTVFKSGVVPMQASKGCPYRCAFCNFIKDRRMIFRKPVKQIIDELKAVSDRGVRYVRFVDDNFRLGSLDLNAVCQQIIDEGIQLNWMSMIRANTLRDVDAQLLRQAGCIEVQLGLESADPQILRNMNKKAAPALYARIVRKLLAAGINCSCYFLFGFPGETDETALRTREFIKSIEHPDLEGLLSWNLFTFSLAPLSPVYEFEMREKYGLTGYMDDWKHRTMDSKQAKEHAKKAFLELENSCPIYRGDNLNILLSLTPYQRKTLFITRHRLLKSTLKSQIDKDHIIKSFTKILTN
jgi:p-methyltransferase